MARSRHVLLLSLTALTSHTAFVYQFRNKREQQVSFKPGDADDMIMDGLRTGDILLFKRNPLLYYFPAAVYILLFQALYGGRDAYDHAAVIVLDQAGTAHVLETTFSSVKLRRYSDRILKSKSEQIVLIPVTGLEVLCQPFLKT
jgi:hypothetical protein